MRLSLYSTVSLAAILAKNSIAVNLKMVDQEDIQTLAEVNEMPLD